VPHLRRAGRGWLVASLLLIVAATLLPTTAREEPIAWCIRCGPFWLSDAISNVVLFIPFGAALTLGGVGVWRSALIGSALSLAIESLQYAGLPPGRTTSLADWLMNTSGAAIGAWGALAAVPRDGRWPSIAPRTARRRLFAWTMLTVVVFAGSSWLLAPVPEASPTASPPSASLPAPSPLPYTPGFGWYSGIVDSASVNGIAVPHGGTGPVIVSYTGPGTRDTIRAVLRARGDDRRDGVVPLLYVHRPDDSRPTLLVGQQRERIVVRMTPRARNVGLEAPDLVLSHVFSDASAADASAPPAVLHLTATASRGRLSLSVARPDQDAVEQVLLLSPGLGWTLIQSLVRLESPLAVVCLALWVLVWFLPGGYWAAASCPADVRAPARAGIGLAWGLLTAIAVQSVIAVVEMPRWSLRELLWLSLAAVAGAAWRRRMAGA
jgi:VanZ family protein